MKRESYYVCMCDEAFDIAETLQMIMGSCTIMCIHKEQIKTLQQQLKEHTEYLFFFRMTRLLFIRIFRIWQRRMPSA